MAPSLQFGQSKKSNYPFGLCFLRWVREFTSFRVHTDGITVQSMYSYNDVRRYFNKPLSTYRERRDCGETKYIRFVERVEVPNLRTRIIHSPREASFTRKGFVNARQSFANETCNGNLVIISRNRLRTWT